MTPGSELAPGPPDADGEPDAPGSPEPPGTPEPVGDGDPRMSSSWDSAFPASVEAVARNALVVETPIPSETVATIRVMAPAMARFRRGSIPIQRPCRNGDSTNRWVAQAQPIERATRPPRAHQGSFESSAAAGMTSSGQCHR